MRQRKLLKADIEHGQGHVKKMLHDRPSMAKYINQDDIIWEWTTKQFAGETVFELNNVAVGDSAERVYQKAFGGELRKDGFIEGIATSEYAAIRNTQ